MVDAWITPVGVTLRPWFPPSPKTLLARTVCNILCITNCKWKSHRLHMRAENRHRSRPSATMRNLANMSCITCAAHRLRCFITSQDMLGLHRCTQTCVWFLSYPKTQRADNARTRSTHLTSCTCNSVPITNRRL